MKTMIYTVYQPCPAWRLNPEVDLTVELIYHPSFDGGRDEPSEDAWVELGDITNQDGVEVTDDLSDVTIRDIFNRANWEI